MGAFLLDQKLNLNFTLQAAESNGEGKVISSPRVVTLDNREAKILQGDSIPFQTFQNGDAQLEFIDAVLSLTVTPHITADKSIIMKVEVTRNAPDNSVQTPTGSPAIAKNEAKTESLVADGQTLVIGGIYTVDKTEQESRVPYLFKIPILGNLFKEHAIPTPGRSFSSSSRRGSSSMRRSPGSRRSDRSETGGSLRGLPLVAYTSPREDDLARRDDGCWKIPGRRSRGGAPPASILLTRTR